MYLASYVGLGAAAEMISDASGLTAIGKWSGAAYMGILIVTAAAAFALGLLTLIGGVKASGVDWREIGYRTSSACRDVVWGVGGYLASLPFLFVAVMISLGLQHTVFKNVRTPQQPFGDIVSRGTTLEVVLVFLAGAVVAPIVEETFFRGVLYSAFRGKLRVWPSVLLTSLVFASIHPLPGGFLPIFTLACVLGLLRERSGSVLPGMVCHGLFNFVQLLLVLIMS